MLTHHAHFVIICLLTCGVQAAEAQSVEEKNSEKLQQNATKELLWEATWQGTKTLALSLENLYVSFYNVGILPVHLYNGNSNRQVSEVMRDENLIRGTSFPLGMDSVLCDINSHICSRNKIPVSTKDLANVTKHIGGFLPSAGKWTNNGTQQLFIPDIDINWSIRFQLTKKPRGISALDMIAKSDLSCEQEFKLSCEQLISSLNANTPSALTADVEASPVLPVPRVVTAFPAKIDPQRPWKPQSDISATGWRKETAWSEEWLKTWLQLEASQLLFKTFEQNLYSQGVPLVNGHPSDDHYNEQEKLIQAISHPYSDAVNFSKPLQAEINVGILDYRLDENHCDLPPTCPQPTQLGSVVMTARCMNIHEQTPPLEKVTQAPVCGTAKTETELAKSRDHGTHVTGLIAAKLNDEGIAGLNPYARIFFFEVDPDKIKSAASKADQLDQLMTDIIVFLRNTDVINISWYYDLIETQDAFVESLIKNTLSNKLFVVAAGNNPIRVDRGGGCEIEPACADADNIITVAGLSADVKEPKIWKVNDKEGSYYGDRQDIAAVAERVFSLTSSNYAGTFSGNSQAAPQVTAAASLLYALHKSNYPNVKKFLPIWVKNRLMYTADLFPDLIDKVWSGRLNVQRALQVNTSIFQVDNPNLPKDSPVTGSPRFFKRGYTSVNCSDGDKNCESDTFQCESINGKVKSIEPIQFKGLRRMWMNLDTGRYMVFYNKSQESQDIELLRITDCKLISPNQVVELISDKGKSQTFNLGQVTDYVSAMY